ncbi:MAG: ABC transporter substrate-binding protein [Rhodospirillaceae bacterium]|jgi:NitT/TauT family transport system substrate-binding protein|nr:ABC transporter substrate-binding protein [Rhodospirillaceae bacterium]MBT4043385.1 ABC transporter substrate-binding protein [Rhodospirillaceae bacterium]MBT4690387.1 ABC transporter substrate-binding protein [Rhodospirillaceae bacterium]MBT5083990.1 ABC transporter substrate-binding protein [Rhodospirillaceae bacterium]MBT5523900.1 ABC transporter substrate-binding protein [Rhodospirillaceae bacterium]
MRILKPALATLLSAVMLTTSAQAAEKVSFILNWVAGGDHAPVYWAKEQGWYKDAGIDLSIEQGKGSTLSSQRVGIGKNQLGIADLGTALVNKGKGADLVAVFNIYANSPYGFYWKKSSGIKTIKDFAGKKIGNPPWDAARQMWPAFAKASGMMADSVTWVNVKPNAKIAALKSDSIAVTTSFYNIHFIFQKVFGDDMGFVAGKDLGVNPYGNSVIANGAYLKAHPEVVKNFVMVTQKAYAACAKNADPCITALIDANSGLKRPSSMANWALVKELMDADSSRNGAIGYFDPVRMDADYKLIEAYFKLKTPFDIKKTYTNDFLDMSVKFGG